MPKARGPQAWMSPGFATINEKQASKSQALFERQPAIDMINALMRFGLGRAQWENPAVDAAIASMGRALKIDRTQGADYRLGVAYRTKGDKPKAIAAFRQFPGCVTVGKSAEDAQQRLNALRNAMLGYSR